MERWGDFFCFVSLSLCSSAAGSFGVKRLDKAAGKCFAAPEHFHGDTEITGAKSRSSQPLSQGRLLRAVQLLQRIWYWGEGMPGVTGMHW